MPCQISKRSLDCARSARFISRKRAAPRAICSWRCGSRSAQRCSCGASSRRCASVKSCHATPCAPAVPANASNAMEIATSLFAFIVVISLTLGLFGILLGVDCVVLPPFLDEPLVVLLDPSAEVLEEVEVGYRLRALRLDFLRANDGEPRT